MTPIRDDFYDLAAELGDALLHTELADSALKDAPIVGPLFKLAHIGRSIPDAIFARKIERFIRDVVRLEDEVRVEELVRAIDDERTRRKAQEAIILAVDRIDDFDKAEWMAGVFVGFLHRHIDLTTFRRLTHAIVLSYVSDLEELVACIARQQSDRRWLEPHLAPLIASGLAELSGAVLSGSTRHPVPSELGVRLAEIMTAYRTRAAGCGGDAVGHGGDDVTEDR